MTTIHNHNINKQRKLRRGVVYILSLAVLALCTTMAVAMASGTSVNITRNDNMQNALNAQLAAEGGLQFMLQSIANADMPTSTTYDTLMTDMATGLGELMNDTANLSGSEVSGTSTTVTIPTISVEGATFACTLTRIASDTEGNLQCQLSVTGTSGGMSRSISVNLALSSAAPGTFGYGIATKGIVDISGNASILSMSDASDASIFSAADDTVVISASGNSTIDGDLYACTDEISAIQLTGNSEVGGETDTDEILASHTHLSQTEPDFPEFDLSPFPGLTTDVVDSSTRTSGNVTFNNIHILPNTNPTFNGNITLNGIVYIEAPNNVKFNGNLVINGFVVTSDGGSLPLSGNQITFNGNVSVPGVDALADTEEFAAVKEMKGTSILAPGFGVTFKGNNGEINGLVAADQLTFQGNTSLGGNLTGMILGLADYPMELKGNTKITINRPDDGIVPAGFKYTTSFGVVTNSYAESTP